MLTYLVLSYPNATVQNMKSFKEKNAFLTVVVTVTKENAFKNISI